MKSILFFSTLLFTSVAFSQGTSSVNIYKDPRIDVLLKKQAEANNLSTRNSSKRRTAKGYRLLIISSNNRAEAIAARTKVLTNFPELKAYMWYQAPYYKVKAGNFTSRNDAQAYQKRMASLFSGSIFIMNDTVEVKPEDNEPEE